MWMCQIPLFSEKEFKDKDQKPNQSFTLWVENPRGGASGWKEEMEDLGPERVLRSTMVIHELVYSCGYKSGLLQPS